MLVEYIEKYPIPSWEWFFTKPQVKRMLEHISKFLDATTVPDVQFIFNAFVYTSYDDLKVVLVGQDPYPNELSIGLSYSTREEVTPPLKNIYAVMTRTIPNFKEPEHGDLTSWATQGVFLINMFLTTTYGKSGAHEKIWLPFINLLIEEISDRKKNIVFMLWGKNPQKLRERIDTKKHYVLTTSSPSPYQYQHGFEKSNHFMLTNKYLEKNKLGQIDWSL